jgi:hypothetical protein
MILDKKGEVSRRGSPNIPKSQKKYKESEMKNEGV